jgi:hypothetical protein
VIENPYHRLAIGGCRSDVLLHGGVERRLRRGVRLSPEAWNRGQDHQQYC